MFGNMEGIKRKDKNEDIDWKESRDRVTSCQKRRHLEREKQRNKHKCLFQVANFAVSK